LECFRTSTSSVNKKAFSRIVVNLSGRRCHRIESGSKIRRQGDVLDPLSDALPRPVILYALAEHDGDQRQTEGALGAHQEQSRSAIEFTLKRDGDLLFDLFCSQSWRLGDNLGAGVRDVWIGVDRELGE
jgi:hypothetical protein